MSTPQPGILPEVPPLSRYLEFDLRPEEDPALVLAEFTTRDWDESVVVGLGPGLVQGLGKSVSGLRPFPSFSGPGCDVPSTQADLWFWLRGEDRGDLMHMGRAVEQQLWPAFRNDRLIDGFRYGDGLDLSGYEDGTENPEGEAAVDTAITQGAGSGLDGSSFVAVQQWVHDLDHFESLGQDVQDNIIGRRLVDNEEIEDAPDSAHVKRTAQEDFDPEAFVVRRSMPWSDAGGEGLMFVAFGCSLDAFEAQMHRMTGRDDGIVDGLFRFTRPITGSYFWCPPVVDGRLNLSALEIG